MLDKFASATLRVCSSKSKKSKTTFCHINSETKHLFTTLIKEHCFYGKMCFVESKSLKPSFPGALGHTQEKRDRHEGELGHVIVALFTIPMFGESISTTILKYQRTDIR